MSKIKFEDNTIKALEAMDNRINIALEECAGELESATKQNTREKTSKTKNNWRHHVNEDEHEATVGNPLENAIWEEFGTGEHALEGNGRKGGWFYEDEEGKGHFTHGKKPTRAFWHAYTTLKNKIIKHLQDSMKGL